MSISIVQFRSFAMELEKTALSRWQKALSEGLVKPRELGIRRALPEAVPTAVKALQNPELVAARENFRKMAPVTGTVDVKGFDPMRRIDLTRKLNEHKYHALMTNPGAVGGVPSNQISAIDPGPSARMLGLPEAGTLPLNRVGDKPTAAVLLNPQGLQRFVSQHLYPGRGALAVAGKKNVIKAEPTIRNAVARHELGEAQGFIRGENMPTSSHVGRGPIEQELQAVAGDPAAYSVMKDLRTKKQPRQFASNSANLQDASYFNKLTQFGVTPDSPPVIGGSGHIMSKGKQVPVEYGRQHKAMREHLVNTAGRDPATIQQTLSRWSPTPSPYVATSPTYKKNRAAITKATALYSNAGADAGRRSLSDAGFGESFPAATKKYKATIPEDISNWPRARKKLLYKQLDRQSDDFEAAANVLDRNVTAIAREKNPGDPRFANRVVASRA